MSFRVSDFGLEEIKTAMSNVFIDSLSRTSESTPRKRSGQAGVQRRKQSHQTATSNDIITSGVDAVSATTLNPGGSSSSSKKVTRRRTRRNVTGSTARSGVLSAGLSAGHRATAMQSATSKRRAPKTSRQPRASTSPLSEAHTGTSRRLKSLKRNRPGYLSHQWASRHSYRQVTTTRSPTRR